MRLATLSLTLALGCASQPEAASYFPTPGPLHAPSAAALLHRTHQPPLLAGPDRLRLLVTDAWFRSAIIYTLTPVGDSASLAILETPAGQAQTLRTIPIAKDRWIATSRHFTDLGLLSDAPSSGEPPALDGSYLLWERRHGTRYTSATYGKGTEPLAQAENWLAYLGEHPN